MSTSRLQRQASELLSVYFGGFTIRENIRPEWLQSSKGERLELDFWIEELDIAIEIQGNQHYVYTPVFHASYQDFQEQVRRDNEKKAVCDRRGINLLYADNEETLREAIEVIRAVVRGGNKPLPPAFTTHRRNKFNRVMKSLKKSEGKSLDRRVRACFVMRDHIIFYPELFEHFFDAETRRQTLKTMEVIYADQQENLRNRIASGKHVESKKQRALSILQSERIKENEYRVWGGADEHIVVIGNDEYKCDCSAMTKGHTKKCSHVVRALYDRDLGN